jgi:hypothetical protein
MLIVLDGHSTLPDGSTYPLTIGKLALGAPEFNQSWLHFPPNPRWNGTFITSNMFGDGRAPSNSYGMHIGSAAFGIPGSLMIGGYDQSRVLSPVSSQPYAIDSLPIDLLDIGIGVADGESPFNFTSQGPSRSSCIWELVNSGLDARNSRRHNTLSFPASKHLRCHHRKSSRDFPIQIWTLLLGHSRSTIQDNRLLPRLRI